MKADTKLFLKVINFIEQFRKAIKVHWINEVEFKTFEDGEDVGDAADKYQIAYVTAMVAMTDGKVEWKFRMDEKSIEVESEWLSFRKHGTVWSKFIEDTGSVETVVVEVLEGMRYMEQFRKRIQQLHAENELILSHEKKDP